jgi:hypothetical protein
LRGAHLKVVYYNGKQIFRAYSLVHFTWVLHVRSEEEYICIYHLSIYVYVSYIHTHIYIYICTHTHTHILLNTVSIYQNAIYNFILYIYTWHSCTQYLNIQVNI